MAIAVDASTPARWSGTNGTGTGDTSASFTAPAGALLVCCVDYDTPSSPGTLAMTCSDSGGLTWTKQVEELGSATPAGGGSAVFTAQTATSAARTVKVAYSASTGGSPTASAKCYVVTGHDATTPVDAVTAANSGSSTTNSLTTTSVTPGASGLLFATGCEWQQDGLPTSSDLTKDAADYPGAIDALSGYKACSSGVGVTANLDAGGTAAAQWKWCQVVVRAAGVGGATAYPASLLMGGF